MSDDWEKHVLVRRLEKAPSVVQWARNLVMAEGFSRQYTSIGIFHHMRSEDPPHWDMIHFQVGLDWMLRHEDSRLAVMKALMTI